MPFNFSKSLTKLALSILLFAGIFQACSSAEKVTDTKDAKTVEPKESFDPSWHNVTEPISIDSSVISVSVFIQATSEEVARETARDEVRKALSKSVDDYTEKIRRSNDSQEWSASQLIALRRFVDSYVKENIVLTDEFMKDAELGLYFWQRAEINKVAFDQELAAKFKL
jgi:hypothetical protein